MAGILEEGDAATIDACIIAAGQRVEHYEMAAYGTLVAWARVMGQNEIATLLEETLKEEKVADKKLTDLAESGINQDAAGADGADAQVTRADARL
jgi:ferritin-like metal-binding protein YciE